MRAYLLMLFVLVALHTRPAMAAEPAWGDLVGRFVFEGDPPVPAPIANVGDARPKEPLFDDTLRVDPKTKGIANVVIYVKTPKVAIHPDYEAEAKKEVFCDNRDFRFVPRVLTVRLKQPMIFSNGDVVSHNANFQPIGDINFNSLIPAGGRTDTYLPAREQSIPQPVGCNVHPWMRGYILARSNPYVAVTGADGSFKLARLPAGELTFKVWHERRGWLEAKKEWTKGEFTQKIQPGEQPTDIGTIRVTLGMLTP